MTLDLSKLRARLQSRARTTTYPAKGPQKGRGRRPPPEPVVRRQEEQRALYEAAEARRRARTTRAANQYPAFAKYLSVLSRELVETRVVEPGLVDLDLAHVIHGLRVHELPHDARVLALGEAHQWIKAVHKSCTRSPDITPYKRLFDPAFVDSLSEARTALNLY